MSRKKFKLIKWTVTIMSNNIIKPVRRFTVPRVVFSFVFLLILLPIGLSIHYVSLNQQLTATNTSLVEEITHFETITAQQAKKIDDLISEREHVIERYAELDEIEDMIHQQLNELPDEALGGVEIPVETDDLIRTSLMSTEDLLLTPSWVERYHQTLTNIEKLEENLLYIPTHWPTEPNKITSSFGLRDDPFNYSKAIHSGIDVRGKIGTPIYAAADGFVQLAQSYGGYGKTIIINHGSQFETLYAHLSKLKVKPGDHVRKGEVIGELGNSGRSTGPHLHYEVIKNGTPVDPERYLDFFDTD